jgi:ABC-type transport system involved in cytochrome bd biosynthesis fused ATPase/permease subunit
VQTSLLSAILGELDQHDGGGQGAVVEVASGPIAYVPQSPWIVAGSIRSNVLFGRAHDGPRYA